MPLRNSRTFVARGAQGARSRCGFSGTSPSHVTTSFRVRQRADAELLYEPRQDPGRSGHSFPILQPAHLPARDLWRQFFPPLTQDYPLNLRQFDSFVDPVHGIVYGHLNNWMPFLYCQPRHFRGFRCRIRSLQLPIYQKAKSTGFRSLALGKELRRGLRHRGANGWRFSSFACYHLITPLKTEGSNQQPIKAAAPFNSARAASPVVFDDTFVKVRGRHGGNRREIAVWTSHPLR
jgi:hypothetical protein